MSLHETTFDYLRPTDAQVKSMECVRAAATDYANQLDVYLPEGPDKTYALRTLRTVNMWAMVAITRHPDGAPRSDQRSD